MIFLPIFGAPTEYGNHLGSNSKSKCVFRRLMDLHLRFLPNGICRVRLWIVWFNASKCFEKALFAHFKRSNTIPFYLVGNPRCSADSESRIWHWFQCVWFVLNIFIGTGVCRVWERDRGAGNEKEEPTENEYVANFRTERVKVGSVSHSCVMKWRVAATAAAVVVIALYTCQYYCSATFHCGMFCFFFFLSFCSSPIY